MNREGLNKSVRVGCIPNSADFKHPADRRRYMYYLQQNSIPYEYADYNKSYDIIYIAINADLNKWAEYKNKEKEKGNYVRVVFDLSDSYMSDSWLKDTLRGIFYFVSGQTSALRFSYKETLLKMIANTDVLLCASEEQKEFLNEYHPNVFAAKDYFSNDIKQSKTNYDLVVPGEINILWEGFSHGNRKVFEMLRDILDSTKGFRFKVHFITDSEYCRIGTSYLCKPTYNILKEVFTKSSVKFHMYDWNAVTFSSIASSCDIALIPIPDDPVMMCKPENKLILLWLLGLPVIASKTASYNRVMNEANQPYTCENIDEWRKNITVLCSSKEKRESYMKSGKEYLERHASSTAVLKIWDEIFFEPLKTH